MAENSWHRRYVWEWSTMAGQRDTQRQREIVRGSYCLLYVSCWKLFSQSSSDPSWMGKSLGHSTATDKWKAVGTVCMTLNMFDYFKELLNVFWLFIIAHHPEFNPIALHKFRLPSRAACNQSWCLDVKFQWLDLSAASLIVLLSNILQLNHSWSQRARLILHVGLHLLRVRLQSCVRPSGEVEQLQS